MILCAISFYTGNLAILEFVFWMEIRKQLHTQNKYTQKVFCKRCLQQSLNCILCICKFSHLQARNSLTVLIHILIVILIIPLKTFGSICSGYADKVINCSCCIRPHLLIRCTQARISSNFTFKRMPTYRRQPGVLSFLHVT